MSDGRTEILRVDWLRRGRKPNSESDPSRLAGENCWAMWSRIYPVSVYSLLTCLFTPFWLSLISATLLPDNSNTLYGSFT